MSIACFEAKDDHKKKNPPNAIHEWKQQKFLPEILLVKYIR